MSLKTGKTLLSFLQLFLACAAMHLFTCLSLVPYTNIWAERMGSFVVSVERSSLESLGALLAIEGNGQTGQGERKTASFRKNDIVMSSMFSVLMRYMKGLLEGATGRVGLMCLRRSRCDSKPDSEAFNLSSICNSHATRALDPRKLIL